MSAAFSAVMVARNEEALIERCLESVAWCDERIVVDMDSADRTRERAARLATKIVDHEWIPYMEWARNRGIEPGGRMRTCAAQAVAGLGPRRPSDAYA